MLTSDEPVVLHVVIYNQSRVGYTKALARAQTRLAELAGGGAMAELRRSHERWWGEPDRLRPI